MWMAIGRNSLKQNSFFVSALSQFRTASSLENFVRRKALCKQHTGEGAKLDCTMDIGGLQISRFYSGCCCCFCVCVLFFLVVVSI
jgi:hypothetical protein